MLYSLVVVLLSILKVLGEAEGGLELTSDNFDKHVDGSRSVLVKFYAPCTVLNPKP